MQVKKDHKHFQKSTSCRVLRSLSHVTKCRTEGKNYKMKCDFFQALRFDVAGIV